MAIWKDREEFMLQEEHLKLMRRVNMGWNGGEFGAPAVDCKRPYGNSDVYEDIAEILGEVSDDGEISNEQVNRYDKLHAEMQTAIEVVLHTQSFKVGSYIAPKYTNEWRLE